MQNVSNTIVLPGREGVFNLLKGWVTTHSDRAKRITMINKNNIVLAKQATNCCTPLDIVAGCEILRQDGNAILKKIIKDYDLCSTEPLILLCVGTSYSSPTGEKAYPYIQHDWETGETVYGVIPSTQKLHSKNFFYFGYKQN